MSDLSREDIIPEPRMFRVIRNTDVTGLSGTGIVAEGIEFSDGTVAMRWLDIDHESENYKRGVRPTTVIHESVASVEALHGHNGATEVRFLLPASAFVEHIDYLEQVARAKGVCLDSGLTTKDCQKSDICDCFFRGDE